MKSILAIAAICSVIKATQLSLYTNLETLTYKNWDMKVAGDDSSWLVVFYVPQC